MNLVTFIFSVVLVLAKYCIEIQSCPSNCPQSGTHREMRDTGTW